MNIFSINQVNQVYVTYNKAPKTSIASGSTLEETLNEDGAVLIRESSDGESLYFQHKGKGGITRSDLIPIRNIMWGKTTAAASMARNLKVATITLNPEVNGGDIIEGQDYIARIEFDGYIGISPEDSKYWKHGMVHTYKNMTASDFYKKLALSFALNMSREAVKLVSIYLLSAGAQASDPPVESAEITYRTKPDTLDGTYIGVRIKEVEQDWILGTKQQKALDFTVSTSDAYYMGEEFYADMNSWGIVTYSAGDTVKNGKLMADFEYFHMGARGDQYRMVGFPDYIPTGYMVDPSQEYDTIGIHYAFIDSNEGSQKSEKDITLIIPKGKTAGYVSAINSIISTKSGVTLNSI